LNCNRINPAHAALFLFPDTKATAQKKTAAATPAPLRIVLVQ
jgi:hypothetical protein